MTKKFLRMEKVNENVTIPVYEVDDISLCPKCNSMTKGEKTCGKCGEGKELV